MRASEFIFESANNQNSNGKDITRDEQSLQNFWKWFDGSKAVDEKGRPMVMYHGTPHVFSEFNTDSGVMLGKGVYFTSNPHSTKEYTGIDRKEEIGITVSPNVVPVYLRLLNPYVTHRLLERREKEKVYANHDGVIYHNPKGETWMVVHEKTQIKSIFNKGTFSLDNPDIIESLNTTEDLSMRINEILPYEQLHEGIIDNLKRYFSQQKEANRRQLVDAINSLISVINSNNDSRKSFQRNTQLTRLLSKIKDVNLNSGL